MPDASRSVPVRSKGDGIVSGRARGAATRRAARGVRRARHRLHPDRIMSVNGALPGGQEGLPLHSLWIFDPVLLAVRVAAGRGPFFAHRPLGALQALVDFLELSAILNLNADVLHAGRRAALADGEVDPRVFQHPPRIVALAHAGFSAEQLRVKPHALAKIAY